MTHPHADLIARLEHEIDSLAESGSNTHLFTLLSDAAAALTAQAGEIERMNTDNKALTNALQRIEAGEADPRQIATTALELPSHKNLYG